jgi:hypothetical protein
MAQDSDKHEQAHFEKHGVRSPLRAVNAVMPLLVRMHTGVGGTEGPSKDEVGNSQSSCVIENVLEGVARRRPRSGRATLHGQRCGLGAPCSPTSVCGVPTTASSIDSTHQRHFRRVGDVTSPRFIRSACIQVQGQSRAAADL